MISLRDFGPADLEAAYELDQACFEPGIAYSRGEIRSFLARPGSIALVAEIEGRLAGFAIAERKGARGHIVTIDIAGAARRRGAGRRLLGELVERLHAAGVREIRLEVDVRNASAVRFYRRMRFRETRRLPDYYGAGLDGLQMVKDVIREP